MPCEEVRQAAIGVYEGAEHVRHARVRETELVEEQTGPHIGAVDTNERLAYGFHPPVAKPSFRAVNLNGERAAGSPWRIENFELWELRGGTGAGRASKEQGVSSFLERVCVQRERAVRARGRADLPRKLLHLVVCEEAPLREEPQVHLPSLDNDVPPGGVDPDAAESMWGEKERSPKGVCVVLERRPQVLTKGLLPPH
jgi:hypothetical protein